MNERTKRLRRIMADHKLNAVRVSEILNRAPQTVRLWSAPNAKHSIPEHTLALLETKIQS